jgi:hypothetical protein
VHADICERDIPGGRSRASNPHLAPFGITKGGLGDQRALFLARSPSYEPAGQKCANHRQRHAKLMLCIALSGGPHQVPACDQQGKREQVAEKHTSRTSARAFNRREQWLDREFFQIEVFPLAGRLGREFLR